MTPEPKAPPTLTLGGELTGRVPTTYVRADIAEGLLRALEGTDQGRCPCGQCRPVRDVIRAAKEAGL